MASIRHFRERTGYELASVPSCGAGRDRLDRGCSLWLDEQRRLDRLVEADDRIGGGGPGGGGWRRPRRRETCRRPPCPPPGAHHGGCTPRSGPGLASR